MILLIQAITLIIYPLKTCKSSSILIFSIIYLIWVGVFVIFIILAIIFFYVYKFIEDTKRKVGIYLFGSLIVVMSGFFLLFAFLLFIISLKLLIFERTSNEVLDISKKVLKTKVILTLFTLLVYKICLYDKLFDVYLFISIISLWTSICSLQRSFFNSIVHSSSSNSCHLHHIFNFITYFWFNKLGFFKIHIYL